MYVAYLDAAAEWCMGSLLRVVKFTVTAAQLSVLVFVFAVQWVMTLCTAANLLLNACTVHEIHYTNWEQ